MKKLAGFLGAVGILAVAPLAHANLQLTYSLNGAAGVICATSVTVSPDTSASCFPAATNIGGPGGGVIVTDFSGTGQQAIPPTQELGAALHVLNNTGVAQTLILYLSDQNFSTPTTPPAIIWTGSLSFTSTAGTPTTTLDLQNCIDSTNILEPGAGAPPAFCTGGMKLNNNQQSFTGAGSSNTDTVSTLISSLGSPYSLSERITLSMAPGASFNVNSSQVLTQVPEPVSIALLGGVLLATAGAIRRKRGQAQS
jgi:hypothetical protein